MPAVRIKHRDVTAARDQLYDEILDEGCYCPCCDRYARAYARAINHTMARALIWLCREYRRTGEWVDVPKTAPRWLVRSNQLPTLKYWGLVQRKPNNDPAKKCSGLWRPTPRGRRFAGSRIRLRKKALVYNDRVLEYQGEFISVVDALAHHFDYRELWEG